MPKIPRRRQLGLTKRVSRTRSAKKTSVPVAATDAGESPVRRSSNNTLSALSEVCANLFEHLDDVDNDFIAESGVLTCPALTCNTLLSKNNDDNNNNNDDDDAKAMNNRNSTFNEGEAPKLHAPTICLLGFEEDIGDKKDCGKAHSDTPALFEDTLSVLREMKKMVNPLTQFVDPSCDVSTEAGKGKLANTTEEPATNVAATCLNTLAPDEDQESLHFENTLSILREMERMDANNVKAKKRKYETMRHETIVVEDSSAVIIDNDQLQASASVCRSGHDENTTCDQWNGTVSEEDKLLQSDDEEDLLADTAEERVFLFTGRNDTDGGGGTTQKLRDYSAVLGVPKWVFDKRVSKQSGLVCPDTCAQGQAATDGSHGSDIAAAPPQQIPAIISIEAKKIPVIIGVPQKSSTSVEPTKSMSPGTPSSHVVCKSILQDPSNVPNILNQPADKSNGNTAAEVDKTCDATLEIPSICEEQGGNSMELCVAAEIGQLKNKQEDASKVCALDMPHISANTVETANNHQGGPAVCSETASKVGLEVTGVAQPDEISAVAGKITVATSVVKTDLPQPEEAIATAGHKPGSIFPESHPSHKVVDLTSTDLKVKATSGSAETSNQGEPSTLKKPWPCFKPYVAAEQPDIAAIAAVGTASTATAPPTAFTAYVSNDPAENEDNNSAGWAPYRRLQSGEERFLHMRQLWWGKWGLPNPNGDLSVRRELMSRRRGKSWRLPKTVTSGRNMYRPRLKAERATTSAGAMSVSAFGKTSLAPLLSNVVHSCASVIAASPSIMSVPAPDNDTKPDPVPSASLPLISVDNTKYYEPNNTVIANKPFPDKPSSGQFFFELQSRATADKLSNSKPVSNKAAAPPTGMADKLMPISCDLFPSSLDQVNTDEPSTSAMLVDLPEDSLDSYNNIDEEDDVHTPINPIRSVLRLSHAPGSLTSTEPPGEEMEAAVGLSARSRCQTLPRGLKRSLDFEEELQEQPAKKKARTIPCTSALVEYLNKTLGEKQVEIMVIERDRVRALEQLRQVHSREKSEAYNSTSVHRRRYIMEKLHAKHSREYHIKNGSYDEAVQEVRNEIEKTNAALTKASEEINIFRSFYHNAGRSQETTSLVNDDEYKESLEVFDFYNDLPPLYTAM